MKGLVNPEDGLSTKQRLRLRPNKEHSEETLLLGVFVFLIVCVLVRFLFH